MYDEEKDRQVILDNIEQYGCHLVSVEADNYMPSYVFSIGLFKKYGHPEIICFGLNTDSMASLINHACDLIKNGDTLSTNQPYAGFLDKYKIQFLQVDEAFYVNYLGYAGWFYDWSFEFPAIQLVWPDKADLFPWNEGFNPDWKYKQPLLDRSTDFKFYEERNLGVFTTKQVLEGEPILYVYHNDDGDWQFHSSAEPDMDDVKMVSLEKITQLDPTVNEIYYLQYGWNAWREKEGEEWQLVEGEA